MPIDKTWKETFVNRWLWLCPLLGIAVAIGVLIVFGFSLWTAIIAALLLVCPALIVWGAATVWNEPKPPRTK